MTETGAYGLPIPELAGNAIHPYHVFAVSLRLPPVTNGTKALINLKWMLLRNPPYNATIEIIESTVANGWNSPALSEFFEDLVNTAT